MGDVADAFNTEFRDYVVDGVPGSGAYEPEKAGARALGALIEAAIGPIDTNIASSGSTRTLTADDAGAWLELSDASGVALTIPANADVAFAVPTTISGAQADAGPISFAGDVGVTVLVADNQTPATGNQGAVWELRQIDTDTWRLYGNLVAA